MREQNRSLFDLLLDETDPWEALNEQDKILAIQILARLLVQATLGNEEKENSHE